MKRFLAIVTVLAASAVWPALSGAATFKGVVVGSQHGTLLVAAPGGDVTAVSGRASVGSRVTVSGRTVRVVGHSSRAVVRGVVVGRTATTMFLSAGRHLLAVRTGRHTSSVGSTPIPLVPLPGHAISATLHISGGGQLDDEGDDDLGSGVTVAGLRSGHRRCGCSRLRDPDRERPDADGAAAGRADASGDARRNDGHTPAGLRRRAAAGERRRPGRRRRWRRRRRRRRRRLALPSHFSPRAAPTTPERPARGPRSCSRDTAAWSPGCVGCSCATRPRPRTRRSRRSSPPIGRC